MRARVSKPRKMQPARKTETAHTCGQCALGCWNLENRNYKGDPFFGYCEHATYAVRKDGRHVFLDNNPACDAFQAGEKENAKEKGGRV